MKKYIYLFLCMAFVGLFLSCEVKDKKTTLKVIDNDRHYYPVLQGQDLEVMFSLENVGKSPFILSDMITSCGCITVKKSSIRTIPEGKEGRLLLRYDSNKNVGYVKHYITLYGNFENVDKMELTFDVRVVPDAHYTKDYEELYQAEKNKSGRIKNMVDGNESNKSYYMEEPFGDHPLEDGR